MSDTRHTTWTEVKKEMDERDTRKLAESVRRWREQSGECGWTDDRVAACVAAHLQPAPPSMTAQRASEICMELSFGSEPTRRACANAILNESTSAPSDEWNQEFPRDNRFHDPMVASKPAPIEGPSAGKENMLHDVDHQSLQIIISADGEKIWINDHEKCIFRAQNVGEIEIEDARPSEPSAEPDNGWARKAAEELDDEFDIMPSKTVISSEEQVERLEEVAAIIRKWAATSSTSAAAKRDDPK